ncbi:MAG: M14 family metallopeptidase [Gammaproteobacteria bacterium]|nr:M14 family metallopeptidase [Gammaproteobacteria bacterium]
MILPVALSINALEVFPLDYISAKDRLRTLSQACPQVEDTLEFTLDGISGDDNQRLSTEMIWLGSRSAEKVLVLISATHGVEGYVGAAVQTDLMLRIEQGYQLPKNTAVLMVFALNPYGFAHNRRCDEMGIDLNRNFIDFDQPLPVNEGYLQLQQALYCSNAEQRQQMLENYRHQWGQTAYEIALSGGQYIDPQGPFYGGLKAAHGRNVIEQIIESYQLAQRHLAVIDIHSGLGLYAHGELINDHPLDSSGYHLARKWYGASVTSPAAGDSSSVKKLGLLDYRWHSLMERRGCFVTLEFGSYSTEALFNVILQDHRCWKSGGQQAISRSAEAMREHFCPQDVYWRELVLVKSRQVIQQAVDGLNND